MHATTNTCVSLLCTCIHLCKRARHSAHTFFPNTTRPTAPNRKKHSSTNGRRERPPTELDQLELESMDCDPTVSTRLGAWSQGQSARQVKGGRQHRRPPTELTSAPIRPLVDVGAFVDRWGAFGRRCVSACFSLTSLSLPHLLIFCLSATPADAPKDPVPRPARVHLPLVGLPLRRVVVPLLPPMISDPMLQLLPVLPVVPHRQQRYFCG